MLRLDIPITKVDAAQRLVYGVATAEVADRAGEICDYATTKPYYEKWSEAIATSSGGKSRGNLRAMHGTVAAGKVTAIDFNDDAKQIEICAKVVDDAEWTKVTEGVYTGFSQGGAYAKRWTDDAGVHRYTADPHEISLVDLPCLAEARFEMIKADGSHEWRCFRDDPVATDLTKIGARNNVEDQERIQAMHDTSVALGAACPAQKMLVSPQLDKAGLHAVDLLLEKRLAVLGEVLSKAVVDLSNRLKAIEDQPQPLPFAGSTRLITKQEDGLDPGMETLLQDPGLLSLLAIKLAQRQGR